MFNWLGSLFSSTARPPESAERSTRFCLALEPLGGRVVPAAVAAPELVRESGADVATTFLTELDGTGGAATEAALARFTESALTTETRTAVEWGEIETRGVTSGAERQLLGDFARLVESLEPVSVGTRIAQRDWLEGREPLSETKLTLTGSLVVQIREALRVTPGERNWVSLQRLWLEGRPFGLGPEGLERPFAAPPPQAQQAGVPHGAHAPPAAPVAPPRPAADAPPGTTPNAHYNWWPIVTLEGNETDASSPDLPPTAPVAPLALEGVQQPAPGSSQPPTSTGTEGPATSADIITRFLPFDTADLRKGVDDFLYGLEPAIRAVPAELFDEWELGAALLAGAGATLMAGKLYTRTRRDKQRGRTFTDTDHERATVLGE